MCRVGASGHVLAVVRHIRTRVLRLCDTSASRNVWRVALPVYVQHVQATGAYRTLEAAPARGEIVVLDELRDAVDVMLGRPGAP